METKGFRALRVWQAAKDLAVYVYSITNNESFKKDYGLRDQMRRAAVSIASNIAEGDERDTDRDAVRLFYIAKGSSAEVLTQAVISSEIGYIDSSVYDNLEKMCMDISKMLSKLISSRSKSFCP